MRGPASSFPAPVDINTNTVYRHSKTGGALNRNFSGQPLAQAFRISRQIPWCREFRREFRKNAGSPAPCFTSRPTRSAPRGEENSRRRAPKISDVQANSLVQGISQGVLQKHGSRSGCSATTGMKIAGGGAGKRGDETGGRGERRCQSAGRGRDRARRFRSRGETRSDAPRLTLPRLACPDRSYRLKQLIGHDRLDEKRDRTRKLAAVLHSGFIECGGYDRGNVQPRTGEMVQDLESRHPVLHLQIENHAVRSLRLQGIEERTPRGVGPDHEGICPKKARHRPANRVVVVNDRDVINRQGVLPGWPPFAQIGPLRLNRT